MCVQNRSQVLSTVLLFQSFNISLFHLVNQCDGLFNWLAIMLEASHSSIFLIKNQLLHMPYLLSKWESLAKYIFCASIYIAVFIFLENEGRFL